MALGEAAWEVIDRIANKYSGAAYSRDRELIVALIEPGWQRVGVG